MYCHCVTSIVIVLQGNYDAYMQTRMELEENQMKRYKWEQDQISGGVSVSFHTDALPLYYIYFLQIPGRML